MKFTAVEEITAPAAHVWNRVADFDGFEKRVAGRTGSVTREPKGPVSPGTRWSAKAELGGKMRDATVTLKDLDPGRSMALEGGTDGMTITVDVMVEALDEAKSRLTVVSEAKARTLTGRLLLQSAKIAKGKMDARYRDRVAGFARKIAKSAA